MTFTIKTLPEYFPEVFARRIIISVIVFVAFCAVSIFLFQRQKINKVQCFAAVLLSLYIVVMLYFTVIGRYSHEEYGYEINFFTSYRWLFKYNIEQALCQLMINLAMLVPVGFLLSIILNAKHKYLITMALSFLLTVFIETMQLVTKCGSFEIDDIINNMVGAIIGMILYLFLIRIKNSTLSV